jgi:hypothetical protein
MKIRLSIKQLTAGQHAGKWAATSGRRYFIDTVSDTEREARVKRLRQLGGDAAEKLRVIHEELETLGAVDKDDPFGYRA